MVTRSEITSALQPSPVRAAKTRALALIPASAPVAASNQLGADLSERRYIYVFPYVRDARWIVLDKKDRYLDSSSSAARAFDQAVARYEGSANWNIVYSSHGVEVLHKRRSGS